MAAGRSHHPRKTIERWRTPPQRMGRAVCTRHHDLKRHRIVCARATAAPLSEGAPANGSPLNHPFPLLSRQVLPYLTDFAPPHIRRATKWRGRAAMRNFIAQVLVIVARRTAADG